MCLLAWNERAKWLAFQTTGIWAHFVSGVPSNSKRDWSLLQRFAYFRIRYFTDRLTLRLLTLFLCLRFIMKWQQKLSVFSKQKRMTVEPENQHTEEDGLHEDGEAEEVSSTLSQPPELQDPTASSSTSTVRKWKKCLAFFGIFYSGLVRHFFKITIQLRSITITSLFTAINKSKLWKAAKL